MAYADLVTAMMKLVERLEVMERKMDQLSGRVSNLGSWNDSDLNVLTRVDFSTAIDEVLVEQFGFADSVDQVFDGGNESDSMQFRQLTRRTQEVPAHNIACQLSQ